ncbi:MAG: hypothetical protein FJ096_12680 [Deltaproteobacteria bacterium]|nr:hypothetical protein [Deltaproteobacteria bacterium]
MLKIRERAFGMRMPRRALPLDAGRGRRAHSPDRIDTFAGLLQVILRAA